MSEVGIVLPALRYRAEVVHKDGSLVHTWEWDSLQGAALRASEWTHLLKCLPLRYYQERFGLSEDTSPGDLRVVIALA